MIPSWIKIKDFDRREYLKTLEILEKNNLNTVCISANCPNRYECFSKKTATFMILGDVCTRNCLYCNIKKGIPQLVDEEEPERIAEAIKTLGIDYAVITCVTRDDLQDGGAEQFVRTVKEIRRKNPSCKIELLISDLKGNPDALDKIIKEKPEVINHNIETVKRLFPKLRPKGSYERSLNMLRRVKESGIIAKSGFMVGLGEKTEEVIKTIRDLKKAGCRMITIGQYLQPNKKCVKVEKFYNETEFLELERIGERMGVKVVAGPLVRSSYKAKENEMEIIEA
ncbi:lipoyl synthase [Candidatus Woesearchaeota archaeon]|nr:MAG: lipoyl synthase [Candidatus Woesearchaeota archaeon]